MTSISELPGLYTVALKEPKRITRTDEVNLIKILPNEADVSAATQLTFRINGEAFYDFSGAYITYSMTGSAATAGTGLKAIPWTAMMTASQLYFGSTLVENHGAHLNAATYYDIATESLDKSTSEKVVRGGTILAAAGTYSVLAATSAKPLRVRLSEIFSVFSGAGVRYPTNEIRLVFSKPSGATNSVYMGNDTLPTGTLSNVSLWVPQYRPTPTIESAFTKRLASSGQYWPFVERQIHRDALTSTSYRSVQTYGRTPVRIIVGVQLADTAANALRNYKWLGSVVSALTVEVDGKRVPSHALSGTTDPVRAYQNLVDVGSEEEGITAEYTQWAESAGFYVVELLEDASADSRKPTNVIIEATVANTNGYVHVISEFDRYVYEKAGEARLDG